MITRRGVLQAAIAQGLAGCFGTAMAQQARRRSKKGVLKKKAGGDPAGVVEPDPRLGEVLAPVRDEHHLPGLIGAILAGDRLAAIGAVGIRKIGTTEAIQVNDKVHLGSCTKAMTATLIGMLVDEGKLSWGSTIRDVFPDQLGSVHPDYRSVTLGQLLTHRASLPHDLAWRAMPGETPTEQRLSIVKYSLAQPPRHSPGEKYEYSNVGYVLAGLMAEKATDRAWEDLIKERLFEPLAMTTAGFGQAGRPGAVDQPWGHRASAGRVEPTQRDNPPAMGPAGTVHCSIPDWARFAALHMAALRGRPRLLKAETFRTLHTPPAGFDYAGGWVTCQRTWAGGRAFNHSGSNTAWFSTIWLAPSINLAFLAATNQGGKEAEKANDEAIVALIRANDFLLRG